MANKIAVVIDVLADKATSSVKGFRQSINDADTTVGKFKAAGSSAFDTLKNNVGTMAVAGGAALVAFGVKAVGAFTETAKSAIDLGAATGLATEDASRWIAVGDDMEVSAEQLTSGLGKIAKSLDSGKWEEYGVATRDAAGNARSTNDILLDSFAMLSNVENATERARIGNELFGKGYANLSPLIGHTREEYEGMLGAVEDGQVITASEAKKAERMRLAQDQLADALGEVTLALGGVVAGFSPLIRVVADGITKVAGFADAINDAVFAVDDTSGALKSFIGVAEDTDSGLASIANSLSELAIENALAKSRFEQTADVIGAVLSASDQADIHLQVLRETFADIAAQSPEAAMAAVDALQSVVLAADRGSEKAQEYAHYWGLSQEVVNEFAAAIPTATTAMEDNTDAVDGSTRSHGSLKDILDDFIDSQNEAIQAAKDRKQAEEDLYNTMQSQIDAQHAYEAAADAGEEAIGKYNATLAEGGITLEELDDLTRETAEQLRDQAKAYAEAEVGSLDSKEGIDKQVEALYNLAVQLAPDSPLRARLIEYIGELQSIPATIDTMLTITQRNAVSGTFRTPGGTNIPVFADGGVMPGPKGQHSLALVAGGETIVPTHKPGAAGAGGVYIEHLTIQTAADPQSVATVIKQLQKRGWQP